MLSVTSLLVGFLLTELYLALNLTQILQLYLYKSAKRFCVKEKYPLQQDLRDMQGALSCRLQSPFHLEGTNQYLSLRNSRSLTLQATALAGCLALHPVDYSGLL